MSQSERLSLELFQNTPYFHSQPEKGDPRRRRMLLTLKKAAKGELTGRQRECVLLYYEDEKSVKEIAACLGIRPPTVSKHLKKARKNLERVMKYYFSI